MYPPRKFYIGMYSLFLCGNLFSMDYGPCEKLNNPATSQKFAECLISHFDSNRHKPFCEPHNSPDHVNSLIQCLRRNPPQDIRKIESVKNYLDHHKVYVSLTSSPQRLHLIETVLKTIDLDLVSEILLTLPMKYKNTDAYADPLPTNIVNFPKVKILRPPTDLGPLSKIVPAIEYVQKIDPQSIVISIDDDIGYPVGIFSELVRFITQNQDKKIKVVGGIGQKASFWHLQPKNIKFLEICRTSGYCDVVEGFGAIAYVVGAIPTQKMIDFSKASSKCKLGDDIVINYALHISGVGRYRIREKYFKEIVPLYYGFMEDALHQQNDYKLSYQQCIEAIESLPNSLK